MPTPHGSKPVELARYLANRFLSDSQRKSVKNFLYRLQRVPIRVLGVAGLIDSQKAELERMKARLAVLDGKLNLALYGLPQLGEHQAVLISEAALDRGASGPADASTRALDALRARQVYEFPATIGAENPKRTLILGISPAAQAWARGRAGVEWVEPDSSRRAEGARAASFVDALILAEDASLGLILCAHRYAELAPTDQLRLLTLSARKLAPGGLLCLEALDLAAPGALSDALWAEPHCLRPYSATLVEAVLADLGGKLETRAQGRSRLFLYRARA